MLLLELELGRLQAQSFPRLHFLDAAIADLAFLHFGRQPTAAALHRVAAGEARKGGGGCILKESEIGFAFVLIQPVRFCLDDGKRRASSKPIIHPARIPVCQTEDIPLVYSHAVCKTNPALIKTPCPDLEHNLSLFQWKIITNPNKDWKTHANASKGGRPSEKGRMELTW